MGGGGGGRGKPWATADAHRDNTSFEPVSTHRMEQTGRQHSTCRPDGMAVRDRATFDVHNLMRQSELADHGEGDDGEGFIDFDALDAAPRPACTTKRLPDRPHRAPSQSTRLHPHAPPTDTP